MNILLDTNAFLFIISDDDRLTENAKDAFLDKENSIFLSIVNAGKCPVAQPEQNPDNTFKGVCTFYHLSGIHP